MNDDEKIKSSDDAPLEQDPSRPPPADSRDAGSASAGRLSPKAKKHAAVPRGPKRRTKTGCLTCRKRRIKCGEEKPRCNNCIKARRECEGYTQRVIFKHALGPFGGAFSDLQSPPMQMPLLPHQQQQQQTGQALNPQQRLLAPRIPHSSHSHALSLAYPPQPQQLQHQQDARQLYYPVSRDPPAQVGAGRTLLPAVDRQSAHYQEVSVPSQTVDHSPPAPGALSHPDYNASTQDEALESSLPLDDPFLGHPIDDSQPGFTAYPFQEGTSSWDAGEEAPGYYTVPPTFSQAALYEDEDEYYDVDSDDEMHEVTEAEGFNQMNLIMASAKQDDTAMRSYNTFLNEPDILASYQPSMGSSPLNNPKTARIWVHFIHATGPSLSIWERHSINSSALFNGPVPLSQQGVWTYTMPLKALEHPALLQGLLAISSLHIANLQQSDLTIAFKHYQYALRKVSKAVGLPLRRKQVATLAATLLLCFYEVISAEHNKWGSHIAGSAQLLKEIDFVGLSRDIRAQRRALRQQDTDAWGHYSNFLSYSNSEDDPFAEKELEINMNVISTLAGKVVDYDRMGHVEYEGTLPSVGKKHLSRKDIENFRLQCDLYWWYLKHDITQSMISGNKFYTPYDRWTQCPPRAALGRPDAVYGSFDHLTLLMGRMTDFGYRDRKRKIKSVEATGGEWRPHQGFFQFMARFGSKPPAGGTSKKPSPPTSTDKSTHVTTSQQSPPGKDPRQKPMYGMAPTNGPTPAPPAFTDAGESPPYSGFEEDESTISLLEAEREWESILVAYDFYEKQLGSAFAPLPPGSTPPISTPFGPALQYRSYLIAVLWAWYYTGRMMLYRLHPCMPPATMISAVAAAGATARYTQIIGKIVAGVYYPQLYTPEAGNLNPNLGAALIQITVPIFFSGVQLTDAVQRGWTVATLRNISRLTGYQSAETIAAGCESAWYHTAKAGRGPPYISEYLSNRTETIVVEDRGNLDQYSDQQPNPNSSKDRRFITLTKSTHSRWAMGLLELETDLRDLHIDNPP
ncbi:hypothetical protein BGW36DRAFT_431968 [Talaromyces proteolyticus]|uniref:Zn(2)-C6 fungal-type domain-containing protein n=1 Tax=Talaromyces proteolyticus TaxID=1131652 RepID=A0AAD4KGV0_9EURO|nr:uncharacterized protein BGW36DRAFT_431968 [Talaromyces proteolyticus]KAH8691420.1 hypothetical protein BGW36DRAFT_431968 [Talaromyces proteolyticus]